MSQLLPCCFGFLAVNISACSVLVAGELDNKPEKTPFPCDDGDLCNGAEMYLPGSAGADQDGCVAGTPAATGTLCGEDSLCYMGVCTVFDAKCTEVGNCTCFENCFMPVGGTSSYCVPMPDAAAAGRRCTGLTGISGFCREGGVCL